MATKQEKEMINRIVTQVDSISNKVHSIDLMMAINTENLKEHMRRTEASEKRLELVEDHVLSTLAFLKIGMKILGGLTLISGLVKVITLFI